MQGGGPPPYVSVCVCVCLVNFSELHISSLSRAEIVRLSN